MSTNLLISACVCVCVFEVSAHSDTPKIHGWHRPGYGVPQWSQLPASRSSSTQLHVSWNCKCLCYEWFKWVQRYMVIKSDSIFNFVLQATRRYDSLCCRLWPVQEDLQWRLLPAGQDCQNACEMDCSWESGWPSLYCEERRGETNNSLESNIDKPNERFCLPLNESACQINLRFSKLTSKIYSDGASLDLSH